MSKINGHQYKGHGGVLRELLVPEDERAGLLASTLEAPRINLSGRELYDLEMLLIGGYSPLYGFLTEEDYRSVVREGRLSNGIVWPMPITLSVEDQKYQVGEEVVLCDEYGNPLAVLTIESVYEVPQSDKEAEAKAVYGTTDQNHPGVWHLMNEVKGVYLGGLIRGIARPEAHDFSELRHTPRELQDRFREKGWNKVIGFQTRNPIHRAHFTLFENAAKEHDAKVLIHPVVGLTKEGDIDYITRVRSYKKVHQSYAKDFAELSLIPLPMRMAGPREALWHAIIRHNFGCTHFIIGRDHAGPGKDTNGQPFYDPYAAQDYAKSFEDEIGVEVIKSKEMVYVPSRGGYHPADSIDPSEATEQISGTQFRAKLAAGEDVPEWFSFPETIDELRRGQARNKKDGVVIFFTGLSGAGKSTIARILYTKLLELQDKKITYLDGDIVRRHLSKGLGFSEADRNANIERIGFVANEIAKHGGIAVCSAIAPYHESRERNRRLISKNGTYIEVFVDTPLVECESRDTKGLYKKARSGLIKGFTGIDDPYEGPASPEIRLETVDTTPLSCADHIIDHLREKGIL